MLGVFSLNMKICAVGAEKSFKEYIPYVSSKKKERSDVLSIVSVQAIQYFYVGDK